MSPTERTPPLQRGSSSWKIFPRYQRRGARGSRKPAYALPQAHQNAKRPSGGGPTGRPTAGGGRSRSHSGRSPCRLRLSLTGGKRKPDAHRASKRAAPQSRPSRPRLARIRLSAGGGAQRQGRPNRCQEAQAMQAPARLQRQKRP